MATSKVTKWPAGTALDSRDGVEHDDGESIWLRASLKLHLLLKKWADMRCCQAVWHIDGPLR